MLIDLLIRIIKANETNARPGAGRRKPGIRKSPIASKSSIKNQ